MAVDNRVSAVLPRVGSWDSWPRSIKIDRVIVAATSSDGDEDIVSSGTSEDFVLWNVEAGTLVYNVYCSIETAWTASITFEVGDTADPNGWLGTTMTEPPTTNEMVVMSTGTTGDSASYLGSEGRYYSATGTIELDISGASPTVGRAIFYIQYAQLSS